MSFDISVRPAPSNLYCLLLALPAGINRGNQLHNKQTPTLKAFFLSAFYYGVDLHFFLTLDVLNSEISVLD